MSTQMPPRQPLVAIIGATGTGKSELAVKLALEFNGEVVNADAMQMYKGLRIITNKIDPSEQKGVLHHLIDQIGLEEPAWTVGQFATKALDIVDEIHQRGKLPIVVGGTHYYTQALLFKRALASQEELGDGDFLSPREMGEKWPILNEDTQAILAKLREVDPVMADRWHPNDRRKIQRSLEIWLRSGRPASEIYAEQAAAKVAEPSGEADGKGLPGGFRFPTLIIWVHADREVLYDRLDRRVDKMRYSGLMKEIETMSEYARNHPADIDRTSGIWISIGYKEFEEYLRGAQEGVDHDALALYEIDGIKKMQVRTRQYAKRQLQWIRIKLIHALQSQDAANSLFLLDGTHIPNWETKVEQTAIELVDRFLKGDSLPEPKSLSDAALEFLSPKRKYDMSQRPDLWERRVCTACDVTIVTESDWKNHVNSRGHRAAMNRMSRKLHGGQAGFGNEGTCARPELPNQGAREVQQQPENGLEENEKPALETPSGEDLFGGDLFRER